MVWRGIGAAVVVLAAAQVEAEAVGPGASGRATAAPVTKSAGPALEQAQLPGRDAPAEPRHGILGAPGSAPDAYGPTRLGYDARGTPSSMGASAPGASSAGSAASTWHSGDRVRSQTSADVRQARQQQAPDLEFVAAGAKGADAQQTGKGDR
ncbi:MAG: hypothetical protein ACJ79L_03510 [Anaeromyxobacteraceae bacterium]